MKYQLEVTTRCNYDCWYCAGRHMPQRDMEWETYLTIESKIKPLDEVTLQGEGEPTLWPHLYIAAERLKKLKAKVLLTTNGTRLDPIQLCQYVDRVDITIDTLDPVLASGIGRHNPAKVREQVQMLAACSPRPQMRLITVDTGQSYRDVATLARSLNIEHIVHPLVKKADYSQHYKSQPVIWITSTPKTCRFLESSSLQYYTWDGVLLPCCFIKDHQGWPGAKEVQRALRSTGKAKWCDGCSMLTPLSAR